jgi:hypothetical protein
MSLCMSYLFCSGHMLLELILLGSHVNDLSSIQNSRNTCVTVQSTDRPPLHTRTTFIELSAYSLIVTMVPYSVNRSGLMSSQQWLTGISDRVQNSYDLHWLCYATPLWWRGCC